MQSMLNVLTHPSIAILLPLIVGAFTARYAPKKGRDPFLWFFLGTLLGLLGLLILYLLPSKLPKKQVSASTLPPPQPMIPQKFWYYLDEKNEQKGPISTSKLQEELKEGNLPNTTFVWNEEMEDWKKVTDLTNTNFLLSVPTQET